MPVEAGAGGSGWSAEQKRNAATIIQIGRDMGMGNKGILIALATAMQESSLKNLDYGDRDSLGLFQQRPSQGWGTASQVTDPVYATKKFYTELRKVDGWKGMALTEAAQAVQRSAYPDAYAKWEHDARGFLKQSKGTITPVNAQNRVQKDPITRLAQQGGGQSAMQATTSTAPQYTAPDLDLADDDKPSGGIVPEVDTSVGGAASAPSALAAQTGPITNMVSFGSPDEYVNATGGGRLGQKGVNNTRQGIVELARQYVGTPYVWGGTDLNAGVDCSGFIQSVYKEMGIDIPRVSYQQANYGQRVGVGKLKPGDLVAWDNSSRNNGADHIAIYLGNGRIIEAPKPGTSVRIRKLGQDEGAWGVAMDVK